MYYGLYISAAGANALSQKVEVLSNNLANVDTAGFKRELAVLEARDAEAIERGDVRRGSRTINDVGGGVRLTETATDYSLGTLKRTGYQTDFALESPLDFFQIQRGEEQLLTRAGNFSFTADGQLVTQDGDPVLAADGAPIQLDPALPWRALPGGRLEQGGAIVELGLARPASRAELVKAGHNCFSTDGAAATPTPAEDRRVRDGYLELSAVNPTQEMVALIETSRAYEANIRMIQHHDGMLQSLVGRVLRA